MVSVVTAPPAVQPGRDAKRRKASGDRAGPLLHALLVVVLAASVFPLYFSFVVASKDNSVLGEAVPPLTPGGNLIENITRVFDTVDFSLAMMNSLIVASTVAISNVLLGTLAGFAFSRLRFRGRNSLFLVVVGTSKIGRAHV